jgi:hypothetical protein
VIHLHTQRGRIGEQRNRLLCGHGSVPPAGRMPRPRRGGDASREIFASGNVSATDRINDQQQIVFRWTASGPKRSSCELLLMSEKLPEKPAG